MQRLIRNMRYLLFLGLLATVALSEVKAAATAFDWNDPASIKTYYAWVYKNIPWPQFVKTSSFDSVKAGGRLTGSALIETTAAATAANHEDFIKSTMNAANIIGQLLAKGAPLDKASVILRMKDGDAAILLPIEALKELGKESMKGKAADLATLKKISYNIVHTSNWSELDALIAKVSSANSKPAR